MSDKVFVGRKAAMLSVPPAFDPISKIVILVDSENAYEAGDDTGLTLELTCPYGQQALADNLLALHKGFTYQPLEAGDTLMDPSAELGDGITIAGVYTILAEQELEFDSHLASKVTAPGQKELEREYPFQTKEQQMERKIARTRSMITKTAEEIRLEVTDSLNNLSASFTVELDKISFRVTNEVEGLNSYIEQTESRLMATISSVDGRVTSLSADLDEVRVTMSNEIEGLESSISQTASSLSASISSVDGRVTALTADLEGVESRVGDAEGNISTLRQTATSISASVGSVTARVDELEGLTVTDSSGTTRIKGSSIQTSTLYVEAGHITGTLTFGQLPSTVAATGDIPTNVSELANDSGYQTAANVTTTISSTLVSSPTIAGGKFMDLGQKNWLKMGQNDAGTIGYMNHYCSGYSNTNPVCVMGYVGTGVYDEWVLAPFFNIRLDYIRDTDTMYAIGNWNFSQATVSGLSSSTATAVFA